MSVSHRTVLSALIVTCAVSLTLAQSQSKLSGVALQPDGGAAANVRIRLQPEGSEGVAVETKSKKDGKYLIGMVRPGKYRLEVDAGADRALIHLKGKAVDGTDKHVLWEMDQDVPQASMPSINVGSFNQISLDLIVGTPSATAAAPAAAQQDAKASFNEALEKIRSGDYSGALTKLEPLLASEPDHAQLNYLVAFADHQLGKEAEALTLVDKAIAKEPTYSGAHVLRGKILQAQDRNADAEAEYRQELEHSTDKATRLETWASLGLVLDKTGQTAKAVEALEKAVAEQPTRELLMALSDLYAKAGARDKAAATLERAEKDTGGSNDVATLNLAISYVNDLKYDDAEKLARRVVEKESTNEHKSLAHSILARCELSRGNIASGIAHLEQALALDPKSSLAAENKQILASLKKR